MAERTPKVIYLSSTDTGERLLDWLRGMSCEVVLWETQNRQIPLKVEYDLGISFLYGHRIPAQEFTVPCRWVNFHPAPLPEYRGRNVAYHAIMNQATHYGATIHYMDATFDTGEIIEVARFPIEPQDTAGDLVCRSHEALEGLFRKYVPRLLKGPVPSCPQQGGRYYRRTAIDEVIELSESQARAVRALTVHPQFHARVSIGSRKYRIVPEDH